MKNKNDPFMDNNMVLTPALRLSALLTNNSSLSPLIATLPKKK